MTDPGVIPPVAPSRPRRRWPRILAITAILVLTALAVLVWRVYRWIPTNVACAEPPPVGLPVLDPAVLVGEGEHLAYAILAGGSPIGTVDWSVRRDKDGIWEIRLEAGTSGAFAALAPVEDRFLSRLDPATGATCRHEATIREFRYRRDRIWDCPAQGPILYRSRKPDAEWPLAAQEFARAGPVVDPLAWVLHLRQAADPTTWRAPILTLRGVGELAVTSARDSTWESHAAWELGLELRRPGPQGWERLDTSDRCILVIRRSDRRVLELRLEQVPLIGRVVCRWTGG